MKRATMELGGHAPAIVCVDADLEVARKGSEGGSEAIEGYLNHKFVTRD